MITYNNVVSGTGSYAGNTYTGSTFTFTSTSASWTLSGYYVRPPKVKGGKFQVRCRGCGRFAKVLDSALQYRWRTECSRCPGVD